MYLLRSAAIAFLITTIPGVSSATESQFTKELGNESFEEVSPPAEAPDLRWDFSKAGVVHTYTYEQEGRGKTEIDRQMGENAGNTQEVSAKGALLIKSQDDKTAELVLQDVTLQMKTGMGEDGPQTMEQQMPPLVMQGIQEDGSGSFGTSSQDMLLKLLFTLPPKALQVGESVEVPAQMPFNAMGSLLQVTGQSRITLTRYVSIEGRTCAQLDVDIDISNLDVPEELEGSYESSAKGKSVFYFDITDRFLVSGSTAIITQVSIDAPMPQMKLPGVNNPDVPRRAKMSMTSDNLIQVKRKEP